MIEDLKSRLLGIDHGDGGSQWPRNPDGVEAVKEIETKDAEIQRLRAALKPFSDACDEDLGRDTDDPNADAWQSPYAMAVTIGDFENARVTRKGDQG